MRTRRLATDQYVAGVLSGDRTTLARTITVIESDLPSDTELAAQILDALLPYTGKSRRIGVTGVPGVGKSTFLDSSACTFSVIGEKNWRCSASTLPAR